MAREVEARLRLSAVDRTARAFGSVERRIRSVERQTSRVHRAQAAVNRTIAAMPIGAYVGPAAVAYGASRAVVQFASWETQLERIGITAGATAAETNKIGASIQRIASDTALPLEDVVAALDTLVASGMDLEEALAFLPSVSKTAQAAGASTVDIANTAQKVASALGLQARELDRAFDIMVAGGKAGQFELKDMAAYIPELANSFASLGYKGQDGLQQLIAVLQTLREDTGSASAAATQAQNIFGKMYTEETAKKFSKFGIDLRKEMEAAKRSGEDALAAFVRLSREAINGDLSKLPLLFTDQEFRLGMQSLITSEQSFRRFLDDVNGAKVSGSVGADFARIADKTQANIQRMSNSWTAFVNSLGGTIAPAASAAMDGVSSTLDREMAYRQGLARERERGGNDSDLFDAFYQRWTKRNGTPWQGRWSSSMQDDYMDAVASFGRGEIDSPFDVFQRHESGPSRRYRNGRHRRQIDRSDDAEQGLPGDRAPTPASRPTAMQDLAAQLAEYGRGRRHIPDVMARTYRVNPDIGSSPDAVNAGLDAAVPRDSRALSRFLLGQAAEPGFNAKEHFRIGPSRNETASPDPDALRQAMEGGGDAAGQSIRDAAFEVNKAGGEAGSAFARMLDGVGASIGREAAASFNANVRVPLPNGASTSSRPSSLPPANVNPGVSMPTVGTPGG